MVDNGVDNRLGTSIPHELKQAILAGDCVAFVGAGFSAAVLPTWKHLLLDIASTAAPTKTAEIRGLLENPVPRDLDFVAAAEILRDTLGRPQLAAELRTRLAQPRLTEPMRQRLHWLRGIPFRAVLTTNFDGLLDGALPGGEAYAAVLRPRDHQWFDERFWRAPVGSPIVKLHGDVTVREDEQLVLSRRDYRRRLYTDTAYGSFLRTVLATTTVLYLGYSFSDSYLNELRSEILALLEHRPDNRPVAYAVVNDVSEAEAAYFERHEGVKVLRYETRRGDFSGFDRYLEGLYMQTNPRLYLGRLLSGQRILWVDPAQRNNEYGMNFLLEAASAHQQPCIIDTAASWDEAITHLTTLGRDTDLVITHWGHGKATDRAGRPCAAAERLLADIRHRDLPVPVIVFADQQHADANRVAALKHGALAFVFRWSTLFREIANVFQSGSDAG